MQLGTDTGDIDQQKKDWTNNKCNFVLLGSFETQENLKKFVEPLGIFLPLFLMQRCTRDAIMFKGKRFIELNFWRLNVQTA